MSTEIEQRIVEMQFDNKQFENNVSTTMSSLDKLKQSLNLTGAAKGLESVGTAASGINLSGLTSAAETVGLKFNAMWTIADQALRNITNSAINAGKRIASALTIEPIKTGLNEYETQINAVQTILANTESKGTTLDDVNGALDTLNEYADKTIYNFTEMTRNIGTFTAAGVDLDTSVNAIQGIANLAAVSGSNSQQASTAMYQLSQALSSGTVKLMDWNSVVNAGMGGQVFQDALKETARVHGIAIDDMIAENGSFRETLQEGWLTADILTETLSHFTMAAEEGSEQWNEYKKSLMDSGYSEEQANAILKLSNTATDAATKVKTATQLFDTLKETAQSGWTQTWEIIFGDFEEAKALFSGMYETLAPMLEASAKARNELLQGWKDAGGRADLIEGFKSAFNGLLNIINPIKEAFSNIFPPTTVDQLVNFTTGFKNLMVRFEEFTATHGDQIRSTFEGIFSVIDIGWTFVKQLAGGIVSLIGNFTGLGGGILDTAANIGEWLTGLRDSVKETDIFGVAINKVVGFVSKIINGIKKFATAVGEAFSAGNFEGFLNFFQGLWGFITKIGAKLGEIFAPIGEAISNVFNNASFSDILNDGLFAGILVGVWQFVNNLNGPLESIGDLFEGLSGEDGIFGGIKETLDSVRGCFEAYQNSLNAETLKKIATAIAILAAAIFVISSIDGAKLDQSLGAITVLFVELMGALAIFSKIDFGGKGMVKGAGAMIGLASALLVLSVAMKIMSTMTWDEIGRGIVGTVVGLGALVAAVNLLPEKNVLKASKAVGKLAVALVILAAGMKIMSSMSWEELARGLVGTVVGLGALVAAVNLLPKDAAARSMGMIGLTTAMVILGGALKLMATMSWDEIARGLAAMGGALAEIVIAMNLMPKDAALRSLGMVGLATAMVILGAALKNMGGMSWEEIGRGLAVMGGALAELAIALNLMNGTLAGSAALIIAAGALAIIAPVMKILGGMSWEEIGKGLVALAGAFAVVGVAGLLLTPLIPAILGLAGAFALFGVATLGIGAGLALMGVGITAIATALAAGSTAIVAGLAAIIGGIVDLIPTVVLGLGDAILALCTVIGECTPAIVDTLLVLLAEVCTSLATYTPIIANALFDLLIGALNVLAERMPELITAAVNVIGSFFTGIVNALKGIDTSSLIEGLVGVGLFAGLIFALSALTPLIPGAMAGVIGMGLLIAELALVLAAVGALAQIPGLSWLIGEGGDLLQQIGTAIGQFVGGLIGGIAEGATSTLPQVGSNLSAFMTNLEPFITGMQGIDASILDNGKALASTILALTAADLLSGIASFFSGGSSLADFGSEVAAFGTAMKDYAAEVTGIDIDAVNASVAAGSTLAAMAGEIPSDGLFGTDGIDDFGKNITKFGECMKDYAAEVADVDTAAITSSVTAAKELMSVAEQIPDDGTFGTDGIDNFGDNINSFAESLVDYSDKIADVSVDSINSSASAVKSLVSMVNDMVGIDSSGVESFKAALDSLSEANFDGFVQTFASSTAELTNVGKNMFNSIIEGVRSTKARFITVVREMLDAAGKAMASAGVQFKASGIEIISKFINGVLSGKARVSRAFTSALTAALSSISGYRSKFYSAGAYLVAGFANGISANQYKATAQAKAMAAAAASAARRELDEHSPSRVGYEIGDFFGIAFVNAIADNTKKAYAVSADMANSAQTGLRNAFDKVGRIISGEIDVNPTVKPVLDLTNVRSGANAISGMLGLQPSVGVLANVGAVSSMMSQRNQTASNDDVVYAINKLQKALGNVGGTSYQINGITYDDGSNIAEAIKTITRAAVRQGRV